MVEFSLSWKIDASISAAARPSEFVEESRFGYVLVPTPPPTNPEHHVLVDVTACG